MSQPPVIPTRVPTTCPKPESAGPGEQGHLPASQSDGLRHQLAHRGRSPVVGRLHAQTAQSRPPHRTRGPLPGPFLLRAASQMRPTHTPQNLLTWQLSADAANHSPGSMRRVQGVLPPPCGVDAWTEARTGSPGPGANTKDQEGLELPRSQLLWEAACLSTRLPLPHFLAAEGWPVPSK